VTLGIEPGLAGMLDTQALRARSLGWVWLMASGLWLVAYSGWLVVTLRRMHLIPDHRD
jgi:hypothetical protein